MALQLSLILLISKTHDKGLGTDQLIKFINKKSQMVTKQQRLSCTLLESTSDSKQLNTDTYKEIWTVEMQQSLTYKCPDMWNRTVVKSYCVVVLLYLHWEVTDQINVVVIHFSLIPDYVMISCIKYKQ